MKIIPDSTLVTKRRDGSVVIDLSGLAPVYSDAWWQGESQTAAYARAFAQAYLDYKKAHDDGPV